MKSGMNPGNPQDQLLARVLAGPLTPELSAELDAWLREDPANPELLAQFILLEDMLVAARKESAATSVLELLLEMEENAEPILPTHQPEPTMSARVLALSQQSSVKWFALAACILLCITAALWGLSVLFTGQSNPPAPLADNTDTVTPEPGSVGPTQSTPIVATLTATHDATWAPAGGASAPPANPSVGTPLHPNQTLTLTAGFAEITTARGAVAILEAPATIELIENDNAIRLHTGKLVGICETESSKGFLVRTKGIDVIDLGTRFGVAIDEQGTTLAEVFTGSVAVKPLSEGPDTAAPRVITTDQYFVVDRAGQEVSRERFATTPFASLLKSHVQIVPVAYTYATSEESQPAPLIHQRGLISDTDNTKLIDGVVSIEADWEDGTNVGFRDDLNTDAPQPRVDFDLGGLYKVQSITLSAASEFQHDALESVRVYASTDGVLYSEPVVRPYGTPWRNGAGGLRQLTIDLSALPNAAYIRVEVYDKDQWTILSEIDFYGSPAETQ